MNNTEDNHQRISLTENQERHIQQARGTIDAVKMQLIRRTLAGPFNSDQATSPPTETLRVRVTALDLAEQLLLSVVLDPINLDQAISGLLEVYSARFSKGQAASV